MPTRVYSAAGDGLFEGPVWLAGRGVLLFSEMSFSAPIPPSLVHELTPGANTVKLLSADSGTNGLALDRDGSVIGGSHKVQGIVRIDPATGAVTTLIGTDAAGRRFNSPNDLAVHSNGTIYFSDPDFQLGNRTSETGIKGVYRVTPSRQVILVDGTFDKPNGVSLSPDEAALYVADSGRNAIKRFSVAPDGSTSSRSDFATVAEPDGMTVDCAGNLYVASHSPGMIRVFSPDGQPIASMKVEPRLTNLAFGGPDRKTLYFTAGKALFSLPMNVPGLPY